jgi:hypothetical protein
VCKNLFLRLLAQAFETKLFLRLAPQHLIVGVRVEFEVFVLLGYVILDFIVLAHSSEVVVEQLLQISTVNLAQVIEHFCSQQMLVRPEGLQLLLYFADFVWFR